MSKNVTRLVIMLLISAIGVMSIRLFIAVLPAKAETADTKEGVSYLLSKEQIDAAKKEVTLRQQQEQTTDAAVQEKKVVTDGNWREAFKDIVISGDSIVKAIEEYGYLDSSQVIGKIGGSTYYLAESSKEIIKANPKYLILHYGENELDKPEKADAFIERYAKCIADLKKSLPDTKIYVDSIFPVKESACKNEPELVNIAYYNERIKAMATEAGVTYLDFTPLWQNYPKDYYDGDGIHPKGIYYTEQYLPYIYSEVQN